MRLRALVLWLLIQVMTTACNASTPEAKVAATHTPLPAPTETVLPTSTPSNAPIAEATATSAPAPEPVQPAFNPDLNYAQVNVCKSRTNC